VNSVDPRAISDETLPQSDATKPPVRDFLDLKGASGATYRFRFWPPGQPQAPIAGNYAYVRDAEPPAVVVVGVTTDLSGARAGLPRGGRGGPLGVYVRLNVSRAVREAEHDDIAAAHPRARIETSVT
jgi:hypothetical protein